MNRRISTIVVANLFALTLISVGCSEQLIRYNLPEDARILPIVAITADFQVNPPPIKRVKNVPEAIRNVPIHSDDWGTPGPIPHTDAHAPWMPEIRFLKLGAEFALNNEMHLDVYGDLSVNFTRWGRPWGGDIRERNYTNATGSSHRGYGAALTYYTPQYSLLIPGIKTELYFEPESGGSGFSNFNKFIGAGLRKYDLLIQTGYDRYDDYDEYKNYHIGDLWEFSMFIGTSNLNNTESPLIMDVRVGVNFNYANERGHYGVDIEENPVMPFFGICIGYRF